MTYCRHNQNILYMLNWRCQAYWSIMWWTSVDAVTKPPIVDSVMTYCWHGNDNLISGVRSICKLGDMIHYLPTWWWQPHSSTFGWRFVDIVMTTLLIDSLASCCWLGDGNIVIQLYDYHCVYRILTTQFVDCVMTSCWLGDDLSTWWWLWTIPVLLLTTFTFPSTWWWQSPFSWHSDVTRFLLTGWQQSPFCRRGDDNSLFENCWLLCVKCVITTHLVVE